jgi:hypothetical protein
VAFPAAAADRDGVTVPGGTEAVSNLLGHVDTRPDKFVGSLNRVLLQVVRRDGDSLAVRDRKLVADYLAAIRELEVVFSRRIVMEPAGGGPPPDFIALAAILGFETSEESFPFLAEKVPGQIWEHRRRTALALGWNLRAIAHRLCRGETVTLEIGRDSVTAPLPLDLWWRMTGAEVSASNALAVLVRDQGLGLMLEGLRRSGPAAVEILKPSLGSIYRQAAIPYYRYGASIRFEEGRLRVAGGKAAIPFWERLTGVPVDPPLGFILGLLSHQNTRAAHLWHAVYFSPAGSTALFFDDSDASRRRQRMLMKSFERLEQIDGERFLLAARGNDRSMTTMLRSVPHGREILPPELRPLPQIWLKGAGSLEPCPWGVNAEPGPAAGTARRNFSEFDFLKLFSSPTVHGGRHELVLRPILRIIDLFREQPALLTPKNVRLIRTSMAFRPAVLHPLRDLQVEDSVALTSYLYAAGNLDCRDPEGIPMSFQGGVALLAALARNGAIPAGRAGELLVEWSEIHAGAEHLHTIVNDEFAWLRSALDSVEPASVDHPGRGPLERRLLASIAGFRGPQAFRWKGMEYRGDRGRDVAGAMAGFLRSQHVLSLDRLGELIRLTDELDRSLRDGNPLECDRARTELAGAIDALPVPDEIRIRTPESEALLPILEHRFLAADALESLPEARLTETAVMETVRSMLGRELQANLYSAAYLFPIAVLEDPDFDQPLFLHGHRIRETVIPHMRPARNRPSAWSPTVLVPASASPSGSHLVGEIGGVGRALAARHVLGLDPARSPHTRIDVRAWMDDLLASSWHSLDPRVLAFLSAARRAGAILDRSGSGPAAPAESLGLALAWLDRLEESGSPADTGDDGVLRELVEARDALGPGWRDAVRTAGFPTPRLNGRVRPWVGGLPPYEALETEASVPALRERMLPELSIAAADYLHRNRLPAAVGFDLLLEAVRSVPREVKVETDRDWMHYVEWIRALDDAWFDEKVKACLLAGKYEAAGL